MALIWSGVEPPRDHAQALAHVLERKALRFERRNRSLRRALALAAAALSAETFALIWLLFIR